jgi:hypothetical protein
VVAIKPPPVPARVPGSRTFMKGSSGMGLRDVGTELAPQQAH